MVKNTSVLDKKVPDYDVWDLILFANERYLVKSVIIIQKLFVKKQKIPGILILSFRIKKYIRSRWIKCNLKIM